MQILLRVQRRNINGAVLVVLLLWIKVADLDMLNFLRQYFAAISQSLKKCYDGIL